MPPLLLVSLRFVLVALPLVFLVPRPETIWRNVVGVGSFMSLGQFSLLYLGLHLGMPAGLASLVLQAQVVFTMVLAAVLLGERATRRQVAGAAVGMAGLATVAVGHGARAPVLPVLVTIAAALSWAIGNVLSRRARVASGLSLVVWSALLVPIPTLGLSLLLDGPGPVGHALTHLTGAAIFATFYTAYGASLIGYAIWNSLLARYPAGAVVPYILLVPVVGIAASWIVQGETPDAVELIGGVVMLAGVAGAVVRTRRPVGSPA
jgi:O-acetylserine/cysteine efflux transporter